MGSNVILEHDLCSTSLRIYKPVTLGHSNLLFKIHGPLVVQTRNMFLCYAPLTDEKRFISIVFSSSDAFTWIQSLEDRIEKKIRRYISPDCLKFSPLWKNTLRVTTHESAFQFSNQDGSPVHLVRFQKGSEVKVIVHVEHVWATQQRWGISIKLLCVQLLQVKLNINYEKMLRLGVPVDAVKQRMKIEGIQDPRCLDIGKVAVAPPPPPGPPPPPPPPMVARTIKFPVMSGLPGLPVPLKKEKPKAWVPSCNDILEGRSRLKSLDKVYYSGYVPLRPIIK